MTALAYSTVIVDARPDRMTVTLYRPDSRNAINTQMVRDLHAVCQDLENTPRPLIITGGDGVFAAGADIAELRERRTCDAMAAPTRTVFDRIAALPSPTVAAIDGCALGGGAELAYACDIRIASTRTVFGNPEPGLGIIAAAGATYRLPGLVGMSIAKQILLAGRTLDAQQALACGLVLEVTEPGVQLEAAHALVDRIVTWAPQAVQYTKQTIDGPTTDPRMVDLTQAVLYETDEKHERMTQFLERKKR